MKLTRLRFRRLKHGISQLDLARRTDVNQSVISKLEHGLVPSRPALETISEFFDLEPDVALELINIGEVAGNGN